MWELTTQIVSDTVKSFLFFGLVSLLALPVGIIWIWIANRRERFLKELAKKHNLRYEGVATIDLIQSFRSRLFKYSQAINIRRVFEGAYKGHGFYVFVLHFYPRSLRLFSKTFTVGTAKFGAAKFPHILLKSKKMRLYQVLEERDRKVALESEYLKDFDLYCPEKYETEALQIFTKEILQSIQGISDTFSIEFGGSRIYVYLNKDVNLKEYEESVLKIIAIIKVMIDKTDGLLFRLHDDFEVLDHYFNKPTVP